VRCFVSHKCKTPEGEDYPHHAFIERLRHVFQGLGIEVVRDPFGPGQDVGVRIETVPYDTFLFLSCEETWESPPCRHELADAQRRGVPIFLVRWSGQVPEEHCKRIYVDWAGGNVTDGVLQGLAAEIAVRGRLRQAIDAIARPGVSADEQRGLAAQVYDEKDHTAVAEFLAHLEAAWSGISDATARYWIALAVGETGDSRAGDILRRWRVKETHPLVKHGIREALDDRTDH
jgi:hypothetical protein